MHKAIIHNDKARLSPIRIGFRPLTALPDPLRCQGVAAIFRDGMCRRFAGKIKVQYQLTSVNGFQSSRKQSNNMSIPRLSFLYPHLFNPARLYEPALAQRPSHAVRKRPQKQCFSTTRRHAEETYAQRYGTAAEPMPPPSVPNDLGRQRALDSIEKEIPSSPSQQEGEKAGSPKKPEKIANSDESGSKYKLDAQENPPPLSELEAKAKEFLNSPRREAISKPLERVLQIETPSEAKGEEEQKPPYLEAPRYVHHFDTFTLVRDLGKGGFTEAQSVTLMKAVRSLLAINMEVARAGLVSKSDVENVIDPCLLRSHL